MELSILERLSEEEPRGRRYIRHNRDLGGIREWLKSHSSEIDEARSRGYSWKQITRACVKKWVTSGQFTGVSLNISNCIFRTVLGLLDSPFRDLFGLHGVPATSEGYPVYLAG